MYLLDSHTSTNSSSLPILDIKSYKHVVYIFDAMFYTISNWPRDAPCHGLSGAKDGTGGRWDFSDWAFLVLSFIIPLIRNMNANLMFGVD